MNIFIIFIIFIISFYFILYFLLQKIKRILQKERLRYYGYDSDDEYEKYYWYLLISINIFHLFSIKPNNKLDPSK